MPGKVIMVQGTASNVGKSILVTALCRIFKNDGFKVAPFKSQNMSLNSFVTPDGGEIGRAQAVQAEAAGIVPTVEMNPILLKPEANSRSQVVVRGRPQRTTGAAAYYKLKSELWPVVTQALDTLRGEYDIVVIEGAGSAAEVNLSKDEIVNMRVARYCRSPVLLVGDIDRGGVFASLLGTLMLLDPEDLALVKALVVNKFRGDPTLFVPGIKFLEEKSGLPVAGVIPYFNDIAIAQEDSVALEHAGSNPATFKVDIAVIRLPHISNFDDFDPLAKESGIRVRYVKSSKEMGRPDLIILPGSKTTVADLDWLRESGLANGITKLCQQGTFIIGVCGGFQMLGRFIDDPEQVESAVLRRPGLGLLPITTTFLPSKETHQVKGEVVSCRGLLAKTRGITFDGYEIHMGKTETGDPSTSSLSLAQVQAGRAEGNAFHLSERSGKPCDIADGYMDESGRVLGTYVHGLFRDEKLRRAILRQIAQSKGFRLTFKDNPREDEYDKLADVVRNSLDMELIYKIAGLSKGR